MSTRLLKLTIFKLLLFTCVVSQADVYDLKSTASGNLQIDSSTGTAVLNGHAMTAEVLSPVGGAKLSAIITNGTETYRVDVYSGSKLHVDNYTSVTRLNSYGRPAGRRHVFDGSHQSKCEKNLGNRTTRSSYGSEIY